MNVDLGELESYIRNTLRIQLDDDDIGKKQLIDLYDYLIIGLDVHEELEKTFTMYMWASTTSASYEAERARSEANRRQWQGQLAVDLKSTGVSTSDAAVKHAYRSEPEWLRYTREEIRYRQMSQIFLSFAIILLKKADALSGSYGARKKAAYGDFKVRERRDKVGKKIKKRIKRKPA